MELFYFATSLYYIDFYRMVRNDLLDSVCPCVLYVIMTRPCTLSSVQNCEGASLCVLVILSTSYVTGREGCRVILDFFCHIKMQRLRLAQTLALGQSLPLHAHSQSGRLAESRRWAFRRAQYPVLPSDFLLIHLLQLQMSH